MSLLSAFLAMFKGAPASPPDPSPVKLSPPPGPVANTAPTPAPEPAPLASSPLTFPPIVTPKRPPIPAPPGAAPTPAPTPSILATMVPPPRLTAGMLSLALGITQARATIWAYPLEEAMELFGITTPAQRAAFLAQCGHESGRFQYTRELWGPTAEQALYEPTTAKSRALGNTTKGDGYRFRGGGLIQITGRYNFRVMGQRLGVDLENKPDLIEEPQYAALASAAYWAEHNLNQFADAGDFVALSKAINCGNPQSAHTPNGMSNRLLLWSLCKSAYSIT